MTLTQQELKSASEVLSVLKPMDVDKALIILAFVLRTISTVTNGSLKGNVEAHMENFIAECGEAFVGTPLNLHNLPEPLVLAAGHEEYSDGGAWRSITALIGPPRIAYLKRRFPENRWAQETVEDCLWRLLGKGVDKVLDDYNVTGLTRERLHMTFDGRTISGEPDHVSDARGGTLTDYKLTSAITMLYPDRKREWTAQTNLYAYMLRHVKQVHVHDIQITAMFRDWNARDAKIQEKKGYPPRPIMNIPILFWENPFTEAYLRKRIALHAACEEEKLLYCTPEERWYKAAYGKYPERNNRCDRYCPMREVCSTLNDGQSFGATQEVGNGNED